MTFNLSDEMKVDGVLRANGQAAAHSGFSGGGSGGSIYITTYHFDGSGQVQVTYLHIFIPVWYVNFTTYKHLYVQSLLWW